MLIERIVDARLPGRAGLHALTLADGQVVGIEAEQDGAAAHAHSLSAGGRLVVPGFVDAHVHLDKAFLLDEAGPVPAELGAAIDAVARLRGRVPQTRILANAERAVDLLVRHGVTAARAHVEIDPGVGLDLVHMHQTVAERARERIELQLVAFPQRGLEAPGMVELMHSAMREGVTVVGGCPYADSDSARHLDIVFAMAERYGAPVDLHLDFSDDPALSRLALVAERTRAHGMRGRVTMGHVTTLAAMVPTQQATALDMLAEADIALVLLPATDLYLGGHGEPGTRSLAPFERARAAGVRVAIANNNLQNPFAPFGNGNLLQAAWLTAITRRASDPIVRKWLYQAITHEPAAILGLPTHGAVAGAAAHLAVLDAQHPDEVVQLAPAVLATIRAGRLVHRLEPATMLG